MKNSFSIGEIVERAWLKQKERLLYFTWVLVVYQTIIYFLSYFADQAKNSWVTFGFFQFAVILLSTILQAGFLTFFLRSADGERMELAEIFEHADQVWRYLGTMALVGLSMVPSAVLIWLGIILLDSSVSIYLLALPVLVGVLSLIFVGLRTIFAVYFVVDQGASPLTALREGWKLSRGLEWRIGLFCLVLLIINLMGLSLAIVGLLITLPLTQLAFALLYRELQGASQEDELPSEEVSEAPMLTQSESS